MEVTFARFVRALRKANIRVSPAETLDAFAVVSRIGISDRDFLKNALGLALAKTLPEKMAFEDTFDRFFEQLGFREPPKRAMLNSFESHALDSETQARLGSPLAEGISEMLDGNRELLTEMMQQAASQLHIDDISALREKRSFEMQIANSMGLPRLDEYLTNDPDPGIAPLLRYVRQYLYKQVKDYVDGQYRLHVDPTSKRAILEAALAGHLNRLPPEYYVEVRRVVERLAKQFSKAYRRRAKRTQRGLLEYKRTIRQNMAYDGNVYELHWRKVRKEPSTIYVVCDVSNSVSSIARFLLLFLYELVDILPRVRAFAFSSELGEVTEVFRNKASETAIEEALFDWGKGNTDYGRAFFDFRQLVGKDLNKRATVIVLGDARSNFYDPGVAVLAEVSKRVKQLFWLNPEVRSQWREGDSEMIRFAPFCTEVFLCNQLMHIERFADRLMTTMR
ncbi:MAG: VWA domain-containing protein [Gammaproteobacteria bacterium]|nr:VWA domain-containing protein [Gammaproteobacteria bacterium]